MDDAGTSRNWMASAPIRPIQVPMAVGAMKSGVDRGAAELDNALRARLDVRSRCVLLERLRESERVDVEALGVPETHRFPGSVLNLDPVVAAVSRLAESVERTIQRGELAMTLGGDHAVSIGSVAGAAAASERLAVIWVDAHADMNWPEVSPSGRIHGMSLAACLGRGDAALTGVGRPGPNLQPENAFLLGVRMLDPGEEAWLGSDRCHLVTMPDVDSLGVDAAVQHIIARIRSSGVDAVHLSFDVDVLDPLVLSGTGTCVRGGFSYREASRVLRLIRNSDLPVRSVDWVELNPDLDPTGESTAVAADLLAIALGDEVISPSALRGYEARSAHPAL